MFNLSSNNVIECHLISTIAFRNYFKEIADSMLQTEYACNEAGHK